MYHLNQFEAVPRVQPQHKASYYCVVGKLHPANTGPKVRIFRENNHHLYPVDVYLYSLTNSNNSSLPTMAVRKLESSCLHAVHSLAKGHPLAKEHPPPIFGSYRVKTFT